MLTSYSKSKTNYTPKSKTPDTYSRTPEWETGYRGACSVSSACFGTSNTKCGHDYDATPSVKFLQILAGIKSPEEFSSCTDARSR